MPDSFLRLVLANQEQPCDCECHSEVRFSFRGCCDDAHQPGMPPGGRVPRPEAVTLWQALTIDYRGFGYDHGFCAGKSKCGGTWEGDDCHGTGRVPRSPAEQHVALEKWLQSAALGFQWKVEPNELSGISEACWVVDTYDGDTLQEAAEAALLASGWQAVGEATT